MDVTKNVGLFTKLVWENAHVFCLQICPRFYKLRVLLIQLSIRQGIAFCVSIRETRFL